MTLLALKHRHIKQIKHGSEKRCSYLHQWRMLFCKQNSEYSLRDDEQSLLASINKLHGKLLSIKKNHKKTQNCNWIFVPTLRWKSWKCYCHCKAPWGWLIYLGKKKTVLSCHFKVNKVQNAKRDTVWSFRNQQKQC